MDSTEEWKGQRKELVSWKINQQKLPKMNNREKKRLKENEESLRDFWDNKKTSNTCVTGITEEEERVWG